MAGTIFWGNRKLFSENDKGVRLALKYPLLNDMPVIGRGVFSIILGDGASIFKLTVDRAAYELAERQVQWKCSALPEILELYGIVGTTEIGLPLYLIKMERLDKLVTGSAERKRCMSISRQLRKYIKGIDLHSDRLRRVNAGQTTDEVGRALHLLADFVEFRDESINMDLHVANFMLRPVTGEIVITDPFMDMDVREVVFKHVLLGKPEGTTIV
jgi:hypothetical protein